MASSVLPRIDLKQDPWEREARWLEASTALKKEDQVCGQRLAEMAKKHSSEALYALDDPLEAAVFSVLVEMMKEGSVEKKARMSRNE